MEKTGKKIYYGAAILGAGAVIAKLLGALYRIPLTKIIGGEGLGLYQTVFPVYTLLLDFSGAGAANAVAKLISSRAVAEREVYARKVLKVSLVFFSALGAIFSLITAFSARAFAVAQGNGEAFYAYITLSPSVFLVCVICCLRGYFQGYMNMLPTAVSQITEQVVKLAAGLLIAGALLPDIPKAVAGATLAITISEFIALIQLAVTYKIKTRKKAAFFIRIDKKEYPSLLKEILRYALPITLTGMMLPVSKVIDSFIIINSLKTYVGNATGLYGLFSGVAATVVGLPVAVCYGIATVAVPAVSSEGDGVKIKKGKSALKTVILTLAVSLPCALFCAYSAPFIVNLLFGYLSAEEKSVSVGLLRISSPCIVLLSLLQTVNAVLVGKGSPTKPIIGMAAGVAVKTAVEILTLKNPAINIYGAGIAAIACYFVANLINLSMVFIIRSKGCENGSSRIKLGAYPNPQ